MITLRSYAKINWTLDVLWRREDGYHEIRTILQTISLHDLLRISPLPDEIEIICSDDRVPCDQRNLVHRAAALLRQAGGIKLGARIQIEKRIPVAAGLGGGSSNAAAALVGLARIWGLKLGRRKLLELAAQLGSDVPFFLIGGTALAIGRGQEVYPLEETSCDMILLANPGLQLETSKVYAALSLTEKKSGFIISFSLLAAGKIHELPLLAKNQLEEEVLAAHPEVAQLKRRLMELGACCAIMSGSGATVFGIFDNSEQIERARAALAQSGIWCERARTIGRREYRASLLEGEAGIGCI
jgi:4-diphosphocytidyl-2-C-methyl-D-erythritol kinase